MFSRLNNYGNRQLGVTLLELLVVMAIASVLLALVLPSVGTGMKTLELESSARRLATAAKFARDQAIHRQKYFELQIDGEKKKVSVTDIENGEQRSFEFPDSVNVGRIVPQPEEGGSPVGSFLFSPGGDSPPFQIILENQARRVMVSTDPLTGFPKVSDL
jgi:general secretion pathway protein H